MTRPLYEYRARREFERVPEPVGADPAEKTEVGRSFIVLAHARDHPDQTATIQAIPPAMRDQSW